MCYQNDRVTLSPGQLTAATLVLPGVAILNRKTISLSRDGQYQAQARQARLGSEGGPLKCAIVHP